MTEEKMAGMGTALRDTAGEIASLSASSTLFRKRAA
jgi:hypothetical protein